MRWISHIFTLKSLPRIKVSKMNFGYNDDFMACPTLECVLRPNACEINRPASTVFWRSTPFWKKKSWTVYKAIYLQILCNFMITNSCHPCQTTHCILFSLDICQHFQDMIRHVLWMPSTIFQNFILAAY